MLFLSTRSIQPAALASLSIDVACAVAERIAAVETRRALPGAMQQMGFGQTQQFGQPPPQIQQPQESCRAFVLRYLQAVTEGARAVPVDAADHDKWLRLLTPLVAAERSIGPAGWFDIVLAAVLYSLAVVFDLTVASSINWGCRIQTLQTGLLLFVA